MARAWPRTRSMPLQNHSLTHSSSQDILSMLVLELGCRSSFLAPKPASQRQLLVGGWLGAESGPEVPARGVGGDGRPSPWMLRPGVV